jgi:hypothetical protein
MIRKMFKGERPSFSSTRSRSTATPRGDTRSPIIKPADGDHEENFEIGGDSDTERQ